MGVWECKTAKKKLETKPFTDISEDDGGGDRDDDEMFCVVEEVMM